MSQDIFKLFGPISVVSTAIAILVMILIWPKDKTMSISQHAAEHRSSYLMMLIVQSITVPMLFLFFAFALTPIAQLPALFVVLVGFACLGLLVAAWIPDTVGRKSVIHQLSAYGAASLIIPSITMLYLSPHISSTAKYMALVVLAYDIVTLTLFAASVKKAWSIQLYFQTAYIFSFAFTTIAAVYI